jgi:hypothetical protein
MEMLEIADDGGGTWIYEKRGNAPEGLPKHVDSDWIPGVVRPFLVRNENGEVILRQAAPGLPEKIGVNAVSPGPTVPGVMPMAWIGLLEYEKVN